MLNFPYNPAQARAKKFATRLNVLIIKATAKRRQSVGRSEGERAPVSIARPAVDLDEITTKDKRGRVEPKTPLGFCTAVLRLPKVLHRMDETDPRRRAAEAYAHALVKLGSVAGQSFSDQAGGGVGTVSDGGVSTRIKNATTVRDVIALAIDWKRHPETRRWIREADLIVLAPTNKRGDRRATTAMALLDGICLDSRGLKHILEQHGWSGQSRDKNTLATITEDLLEHIADGIGVGAGRCI